MAFGEVAFGVLVWSGALRVGIPTDRALVVDLDGSRSALAKVPATGRGNDSVPMAPAVRAASHRAWRVAATSHRWMGVAPSSGCKGASP